MKNSLFVLPFAGLLALASCSQEKTTETTVDTTTTTSTTDDVMYHSRANRIARQMATDLSITDTATVARAENVYYNRSRRLAEVRAQHTADTTGQYAQMQTINSAADAEFETVFSDPAQYQSYTARRLEYADDRYADETDMPASGSATGSASAASSPAYSDSPGETKTDADGGYKTKYEDGTKVKVDANGDTKVKNADGSVLKIDENGDTKIKGDDGKVKMDPSGDTKVKNDAMKMKADANGETKVKEE